MFGSANELPIIRGDSLKYLVLFRGQLTADQILECFRGENGKTDKSIIRFLSSNHFLLHHYAAYAIERLLMLKIPNTQNQVKMAKKNHLKLLFFQSPFTSETIQLGTLIDALFGCFALPQAYETHYIMKALMRTFSIINVNLNHQLIQYLNIFKDEMAQQNAHIYVSKLSQMIVDAIRVPKNPLLVHFIFESLCVLIKKVKYKN